MQLRYLLDENQRGPLWHVIQRHNARGIDPIDALRVGDMANLPLGCSDDTILEWCGREERILVTLDKHTIPTALQRYLDSNERHPGVFLLRRDGHVLQILEFLVVAAFASEAYEWQNRIIYIP